MAEEELTFLIPRNVGSRFEIIPGLLGLDELRRLLPWGLVAAVVGLLPYGKALPDSPSLAVALHLGLPALTLAAGVLVTVVPIVDGLTLAQQVALRRRHRRRQRVYRYERGG